MALSEFDLGQSKMAAQYNPMPPAPLPPPLPPLRIRVEQLEKRMKEIGEILDLLSEGLQHLRGEVG